MTQDTTPSIWQELPNEALREELTRLLRANDDRKTAAWTEYLNRALRERARFLVACERDPFVREIARRLVYSDGGFWFFARTFGVVWERRSGSGLVPFIPYIHQEWVATFFFTAMEEEDQGLVFKTRDMGVSWMVYHMLVWLWLTRDNFSALLGSRTEDQVDKSANTQNDQTMFGRLEIIVDALPGWLKGDIDTSDKDQRQRLWWRNPLTGNTFVGEAATAKFGRQGRHTVAVLDEFDHWDDPMGAITAVRDACRSVWLITTPDTKGGSVSSRLMEETEIAVLKLPWYFHPHKDSAWRKRQEKGRLRESLATEIDLSTDGATGKLIYPEWERCPKGDFPFRPGWHTFGGIDFGRSDGTGIVYVQRSPLSLRRRILGSVYDAGKTIEFFVPFMGGRLISNHAEYDEQQLDMIERARIWSDKYTGIEWFGDPAGRQKTITMDKSVLDVLRDHRIYVRTNPRAVSHADRQGATHQLLAECDVNIADCGMLDWSMRRYRRADLGRNSTADRNRKPVHDRASHVPAALEYVAVNLPGVETDEHRTERLSRTRSAWEDA